MGRKEDPGPPHSSASSFLKGSIVFIALGRKAVTLVLQPESVDFLVLWAPVLAGERILPTKIKGRTWSTVDHSFFFFFILNDISKEKNLTFILKIPTRLTGIKSLSWKVPVSCSRPVHVRVHTHTHTPTHTLTRLRRDTLSLGLPDPRSCLQN